MCLKYTNRQIKCHRAVVNGHISIKLQPINVKFKNLVHFFPICMKLRTRLIEHKLVQCYSFARCVVVGLASLSIPTMQYLNTGLMYP